MKTLIRQLWKPVQRFGRWLFGSPFRELPWEFGDPVPPEWHGFEARAGEVQHRPQGDFAAQRPQNGRGR